MKDQWPKSKEELLKKMLSNQEYFMSDLSHFDFDDFLVYVYFNRDMLYDAGILRLNKYANDIEVIDKGEYAVPIIRSDNPRVFDRIIKYLEENQND